MLFRSPYHDHDGQCIEESGTDAEYQVIRIEPVAEQREQLTADEQHEPDHKFDCEPRKFAALKRLVGMMTRNIANMMTGHTPSIEQRAPAMVLIVIEAGNNSYLKLGDKEHPNSRMLSYP